MMKNRPSLIFFGNEQLAQGLTKPITPTFSALIEHGYPLAALILPSKNAKKPLVISKIAKLHNIPTYYTRNSDEILTIIKKTQASLAVLASFGKIIPQSIINAFPFGIINIHPSLLPRYRGTTPIESAILNGDNETGVSIMRLVKAMDAGPILAQEKIVLNGTENKQQIYEQLAYLGTKLILQTIDNILKSENSINVVVQDESKASFSSPLDKTLSLLNPTDKSATRLTREIRAYAGFPKSKMQLFDLLCTVTVASVGTSPQTLLDKKCKDNKFLIIERLIPPGRKEMSAKDFIHGYCKKFKL